MYRCKALVLIFLLVFSLNANDNITKKHNETFIVLRTLIFESKNPAQAIYNFDVLYNTTNKPEYLKEAIKISYIYKNSNIGSLIEKADSVFDEDSEYIKIKVAYLLETGKNVDALTAARELVRLDKVANNYAVLGMIEYDLNLNDDALEHFREAFRLDLSDENLLRVVNTLIVKFNDITTAVKELETYRQLQGCSVMICSILADIYRDSKNLPKLVEVYEDLFKLTDDDNYLDLILSFYLLSNDYDSVTTFLEKYRHNDKFLVEIYTFKKDYDKAINLAKEGFKSSDDYEFLALEAIATYEKYQPSPSNDVMDEVTLKFEISIAYLDKAIYQNYYGYLLIDHDIDPQKGINLVQKALKSEPDSFYYLDSLAWGYFKLGQCRKAKDVLDKIGLDVENYWDSDEGKFHLQEIDRCLKESR
ncbi:MAG: hypothetical protein GXZ15_05405 [Campylobacter sp.]|nr:hypothetical protein [Campylobacter sp.]